MRLYRDAFKFFLKYFGTLVLTWLLICLPLMNTVSESVLGFIMLFGPWFMMYFVLVKLLKRYRAFYCDITKIRAEVKSSGLKGT